jgi:hypothetical protein
MRARTAMSLVGDTMAWTSSSTPVQLAPFASGTPHDVVIVLGIQVAGDWGRVRAASTALTIALLSAPRCAAVFPPFYLFG